MNNIKFLNHSSVLIQDKENFVLTDPWYEKPAFGSWLSTPPCSIHPAYLVSLSKTVENFTLVISHGHDDHLDDFYLSLFPKETKVLIPKYKSRGLLKRLNRSNLTNIFEADEEGVTLGGFTFKSYINPFICPDDAIITIEGTENFIIHANDNWQKLRNPTLSKILKDSNKYEPQQKIYMSQCNAADGWPYIYRDYSKDEKRLIHKSRLTNIITNTLQNASSLDCKYFLNYAGHAAPFVKEKPELRKMISYVSNHIVKNIAASLGTRVQVLDMIPGDTFDFNKVTKQFFGISLEDSVVKQSSYDFYEAYDNTSNCDSFRKKSDISEYPLKQKMDSFLSGFDKFVMDRVHRSDFNIDIVGFKIVLNGDSVSSEKVIGGNESFNGKMATFYVKDYILQKLLSGEIIWENLYIGYQAEVQTSPLGTNIRAPVRWLASYGYVYQLRCKKDG
tara:strand:- start:10575 stop:11912 length:1338 start_codon:yes stop_codon:yes gene_type:complete